jgi:hypothetical protein
MAGEAGRVCPAPRSASARRRRSSSQGRATRCGPGPPRPSATRPGRPNGRGAVPSEPPRDAAARPIANSPGPRYADRGPVSRLVADRDPGSRLSSPGRGQIGCVAADGGRSPADRSSHSLRIDPGDEARFPQDRRNFFARERPRHGSRRSSYLVGIDELVFRGARRGAPDIDLKIPGLPRVPPAGRSGFVGRAPGGDSRSLVIRAPSSDRLEWRGRSCQRIV